MNPNAQLADPIARLRILFLYDLNNLELSCSIKKPFEM